MKDVEWLEVHQGKMRFFDFFKYGDEFCDCNNIGCLLSRATVSSSETVRITK